MKNTILVTCLMLVLGGFVYGEATYNQPDYDDPPTESDLHDTPYRGHGFFGTKLFWELTELGAAAEQEKSRGRCQKLKNKGIHPMFQLFAWNNTFQLAVDGDFDDDPAMRKWADWTMARKDEYWARLEDGTIWSWNNLEMGYITLPQPIHQSDILPGMPSDGNWGDWMAAKLVDLCVKTGFRGISMADGFCLLRRPGVRRIDFHPEIMDAFESQTGISLTGTDPERAESILKNHRNAWTDWWARQFAVWFRKLDEQLFAETGEHMLFRFQNDMPPDVSRITGIDFDILLDELPTERFLFTIEPNAFASHPARSFGNTVALTGLVAGRTPDFRCGVRPIMAQAAQFDSLDDTGNKGWPLWEVVGNTMPNADAEERLEWIWKYMKHHLLGAYWAHVATSQGTTRRAIGYHLRYRNDQGVIPALIDSLMRAHVPAAPFGPAVYYSRAVERSYESDDDRVPFETIDAAIDSGAPTAYFVSDHGLANLRPEHYPSSWLTISPERLPAQERSRLEAIAPVKSFSDPIDGPLTFSGNARGFSFFDPSGDLVILAARKDWDDQQAVEEDVTITLAGLEDGTYTLRDALKDPYDETFPLSVTNGSVSVSFPLERWDTRVFVLDYDKTSTATPHRSVRATQSSSIEVFECYTIDGRMLHRTRRPSTLKRLSSHRAPGIVVIRSKDRKLTKKVLMGNSGF